MNPSLRRKIAFSYALFASLILLLALFALADLLYLETQIAQGRVVTLLKNDALEMRRHEKNLLLYRNRDELTQLQQYITRVDDSLNNNRALFASLIGQQPLVGLTSSLARYRELFSLQQPLPANPEHSAQARELGHTLSDGIDQLASQERQQLVAITSQAQTALIVAIVILAVLILIIGWQITRAVVTPLNSLENQLILIAEGQFDYLKPVTRDQELVTLTRAFNRILQELDMRHRRLLQAEKLASLGVLVSGVAHELNNPLGNISSSCQLLIEEQDVADIQQRNIWLKQIDAETERARNIVRTLLDYGQKKDFHQERLQLLAVMNKTLLLLRNQLKHSATVVLDIPEDVTVYADLQRLQQVFINLIRNALDAGGDQAQLLIRASNITQFLDDDVEGIHYVGESDCVMHPEGRYSEILISDNGPGIAADDLNHIFDPFFTTREPGHGTGLGLFIVQEIIQEHGGCIGVLSQPGQGCQFLIRLPQVEATS